MPLRLLYQTAATCEQYFNQEKQNPVLTWRITAIAEGVGQHGPMEERSVRWTRLKRTEIVLLRQNWLLRPCVRVLSLLQDEARPPVVSSGQNWNRSGNAVFPCVTRPSSCPDWDFKPYSAFWWDSWLQLVPPFIPVFFYFTAVVQYIFQLYWKEILVQER